ncbi:MAG: hypothetical protein PHW04_11880, partial [Candidatus Wallbacteria bacterium]|nr:hypothetical protein [Candidatus Wallbacteria bacterium]
YSIDGITWIATAAAAWPARYGHSSLVYDNKMWVIGGYSSGYKNDVWYSTDGSTWNSAATSASWSARYCHSSLVYDDKMWMIGGYGSSYYNDIWYSSDGVTWTLAADNAAWASRYSQVSLVYDDKMWVIGGYHGSYYNDVWFTSTSNPVSTPLYMTTSPRVFETHPNGTVELRDIRKTIFYSNNATQEANSVTYSAISGTISGTVYTAPAAAGADTLEISCSENGRTITAHLKISITCPLSLALNPQTLGIPTGTTYELSNVRKTVTYSSSTTLETSAVNYAVSRGSVNGSLYTSPESTGTDTIEISYSEFGISVSAQLIVTVRDPLSLAANPQTLEIGTDRTYELSAVKKTVYFSNSTTREVTNVSCNAVRGSISGTLYSAPGSIGTDTIEISYTEFGKKVSIDLIVTNSLAWIQATANAAWVARDAHHSVVFNGRMWVIGGWDDYYALRNEVWSSADGINWQQATSEAPCIARVFQSSLVFKDKLWVMGGCSYANSTYTNYNDVQCSTDGKNWVQATASAAWSPRRSQSCLVYDNRMWVLGGLDNNSTYQNDVWYSDDGITWIQATASAAWSPRSRQTILVYDNRMWVIGGYAAAASYNDAWYSTDGVTWIQATASAPWIGRGSHTSLVYDDKMWVLGGDNSYNENTVDYDIKENDVWYSTDGAAWTQANLHAPWAARWSQTSLVFNDKMWVIGGWDGSDDRADVWSATLSAPVKTPLYMTTSQPTLEVQAGGSYDCSNLHKCVYYSDNSSLEVSSVSYNAVLGSFNSSPNYTAPADFSVDTIEIIYTESSRTITTHVMVYKTP